MADRGGLGGPSDSRSEFARRMSDPDFRSRAVERLRDNVGGLSREEISRRLRSRASGLESVGPRPGSGPASGARAEMARRIDRNGLPPGVERPERTREAFKASGFDRIRGEQLADLRRDHGPGVRSGGRSGDYFPERRGGPHGGYGAFYDRYRGANLDHLARSAVGGRHNFVRQFDYFRHGDVARRLGHLDRLSRGGGWRYDHHLGHLHNTYVNVSFGGQYWGPRWYPHRVWYPHWRPWVRWSFWDWVHPWYDPRPYLCRPILYDPCPAYIATPYFIENVTVWSPLPTDPAGTWVEPPPVVETREQPDLELLAVRFVDAGHPEEEIGPRYRVWVRNNSGVDVDEGFNVILLASLGDDVAGKLPQDGVRIDAIKAGETQPVDLRLPFAATAMVPAGDASAKPAPFDRIHVLVDAGEEIAEVDEKNNGANLAREEAPPVDPALFSTDLETGVPGADVALAGEGLGPEPGQVVVFVKGLELDAKIKGWYDLGVLVELPEIPLAGTTDAEIVVIRGDGTVSNALKLPLAPKGSVILPPPPVELEGPAP